MRGVLTNRLVQELRVILKADAWDRTLQWNITAKGDDTYFLESLDPTFFAFLNPPAMQGQAITTATRPVKWVIESVGSGRYRFVFSTVDQVPMY
jgi:hypothetical protein